MQGCGKLYVTPDKKPFGVFFVLLLFLPASSSLGVVVYNIHIPLSSTRTRSLSVVRELSFQYSFGNFHWYKK